MNLKLNLNDPNSRKYLWNLLKKHSTQDELIEQFGSTIHNRISFWDLVQLKLKFSKTNMLKTTYEIIDDYTILYSNMSTLLETIVNEHSTPNSGKKVTFDKFVWLNSIENTRKLIFSETSIQSLLFYVIFG